MGNNQISFNIGRQTVECSANNVLVRNRVDFHRLYSEHKMWITIQGDVWFGKCEGVPSYMACVISLVIATWMHTFPFSFHSQDKFIKENSIFRGCQLLVFIYTEPAHDKKQECSWELSLESISQVRALRKDTAEPAFKLSRGSLHARIVRKECRRWARESHREWS